MTTTQYGGGWLDKKMNEPIDERRITRSTPKEDGERDTSK
jgi:hypothetical protein